MIASRLPWLTGRARAAFLTDFLLLTIPLWGAGAVTLPLYMAVLGRLSAICMRILGAPAAYLGSEGSVERATLALSVATAAQPARLHVVFPILGATLFTALVLATPGLSLRRRMVGLAAGHAALLLVRALALVGTVGLESAGFDRTPTLEPVEAVVVVLTALDRAGPFVAWFLVAAPSLGALLASPGRGPNR